MPVQPFNSTIDIPGRLQRVSWCIGGVLWGRNYSVVKPKAVSLAYRTAGAVVIKENIWRLTPGFHRTRYGNVTAAARLGRDFALLAYPPGELRPCEPAVFTRDHEIPR